MLKEDFSINNPELKTRHSFKSKPSSTLIYKIIRFLKFNKFKLHSLIISIQRITLYSISREIIVISC